MGILVQAEFLAVGGSAVLGMGQKNAGQLLAHGHADVLAHGAQCVADGGGNHAVQQVQRTVQQHFKVQLGDGAVKRGAVFLGLRNGLVVAAPQAEGHHPGGGHQLLGRVIGHHADTLFSLRLILFDLLLGVFRHGGKFLYNRFDAHALASFCFMFSSMASTRPCTRVSYWASLKLRGSA
ncbi:hypothetical protein SDC9_186099 [bioreactor metagenome]|uniref:Uncharacterized protein n=1 Tax=bioreactor metagenome TaxID=1076179 RepID=A0A645HHR4_9ZZZZ